MKSPILRAGEGVFLSRTWKESVEGTKRSTAETSPVLQRTSTRTSSGGFLSSFPTARRTRRIVDPRMSFVFGRPGVLPSMTSASNSKRLIDAGDKVIVFGGVHGRGAESGADVKTPTF